MSTIRIKRSTSGTAPTGLTFGEPAFVDGLNSLYVAKNDGTSLRVGAEIDTTVTLGTSDNKIPTQKAVKTYIDNNIAGGSVSSVNGLTGAVSIYGGSGISVAAASGGITLTNTGVQSLNGVTGAVTNVARINEGNTYSVKQVMNAGITASTLNVAGVAAFNANIGDITLSGTNTYLNSTTTTVQNATALFSITPSTLGAVNGTLRLKGYDGDVTAYNNDIKPQATQTGNLVHTLPATTGTLLNSAVTSAVAGTGISVSASTGAVTFTNTGVQSAIAGNQITVSGATGAVTIAVTATPSFTSITTTNDGTIGGNLVVTGNLTINGTSTTVNSNTMTIDDPLIVLGTSGGLPITASDAGKDRGIVFNYYDTAGRTGFFGWDASAAEFVFQKNSTVTSEVVTGVSYGNLHVASLVLQNGAVTDTVVGSAAGAQTHTFRDYGGTIVTVSGEPTTGYILKGNALGAHTWQDPNAAGFTAYAAGRLTPRNIALSGEVTGTVSFDGTADVSITTTIAANSVALGTDTTGNYAQDVSVAGIGLTISGAAGEGTQYIITSGATSANTASQIVARDASGNFTAGTITASLTGNVSGSAATLTTTRAIGLTGDIFGSANFNGSADINITATIAAGSILDADINASAGIVDTKLATISTANKVSLSALDIDGGTVTTSIAGTDLLIVDNGANGTNRKVTVNNLFGSTSTAVVDGGTY